LRKRGASDLKNEQIERITPKRPLTVAFKKRFVRAYSQKKKEERKPGGGKKFKMGLQKKKGKKSDRREPPASSSWGARRKGLGGGKRIFKKVCRVCEKNLEMRDGLKPTKGGVYLTKTQP